MIVESEDGRRQFEFQKGPVFTQILLADEINRATPKTQSAMLETMQEGTVTAAGSRYQLDKPFFVLATQNPIEQEGTYPLPEAQLDRFLYQAGCRLQQPRGSQHHRRTAPLGERNQRSARSSTEPKSWRCRTWCVT